MALQVQERTTLSKVDWNLILVILAINLVGLINLYSATSDPHTRGVDRLFISQSIYMVAGWGIFTLLTFVDYKIFLRLAYPIYGINCCFLFLVDVLGHTALGGQRWIDLGVLKYQPSETLKVAMVLVIARHFQNKSTGVGFGFSKLFVPAILLFIPTALVIKQPDLGTGLMLVAVTGTMLLF
ncbi:MAG: FtsW/RodA/SpoVE family cell cycle protein, partial [Oligoflexia bacterium]|nr:FtsW/RodA/SpoVE family cell cycle protein [Oligoflexia bacterium]